MTYDEPASDPALDEQIAYYRARADEYDDWFLRRGRYDHGAEWNRQWRAEVGEVRAALDRFGPSGRVLELACGTGWWTEQLLRHTDQVTAVDASPEVLAINRARRGGSRVTFVQADLFRWTPDAAYDVVFFGFWLSHVPPDRFDQFWRIVRAALAPGGRAFFVDSLAAETSAAADQRPSPPEGITALRRLGDGRQFRIYKVFYEPRGLEQRLDALGWRADVRATEHYFLYGSATPAG